MPEARGDLRELLGEPVFVPLYSLFRAYGPIFKLSFGPQTFVIISDPEMARQARSMLQCLNEALAWLICLHGTARVNTALNRVMYLQILLTNAPKYSKGLLSEILEFVMGTGLIPADGEIWKVRRRCFPSNTASSNTYAAFRLMSLSESFT